MCIGGVHHVNGSGPNLTNVPPKTRLPIRSVVCWTGSEKGSVFSSILYFVGDLLRVSSKNDYKTITKQLQNGYRRLQTVTNDYKTVTKRLRNGYITVTNDYKTVTKGYKTVTKRLHNRYNRLQTITKRLHNGYKTVTDDYKTATNDYKTVTKRLHNGYKR